MSAASNFVRWHAAVEGLEAMIADGRPERQLAAARVTVSETLETLLRSLITTNRRSDLLVERLADRAQETIDAETERIWERLDAHARRIALIEAALAEAEDAGLARALDDV
jgi:hypothetical protein